jgi:hypothetical protein
MISETPEPASEPRGPTRRATIARRPAYFTTPGLPWQSAMNAALSLAIVVVSVMPLLRFVGLALQRLNYPFELEWIEGGTVGHIQVVLAGKQLYREPSLEFTPFIYAPLYYYVSALPTLVLGVGLLAPRLVSFVSILGCFVLLGRWVRDETGDAAAGVAAAGLLSSLYQLTGQWMDLARVDSFFLFLTFAANVLARSTYTRRRAACVGALLAAACFTKQIGIPLALPALVFLCLRSFPLGLVAALVAGGIAGVVGLAFQISSSGWFFYYVFKLPTHHAFEWPRLIPETQTYFLGSTLPLTLAGVALLCGSGFSRRQHKQWLFTALFVTLAVTASFLPFLKSGGYVNGLLPAFAALCLAAGIQLGALRNRGRNSALGAGLFGALVLAYQCAQLAYDPSVALPTAADLAANQQALARMKKLPKPIWVTASSHWTRICQEGGVPLHAAGLSDVFKGGGAVAAQLRKQIAADLSSHRFATIVVDRAYAFLPSDVVQLIEQEYRPRGSVMSGVGPGTAWPKTGALIRPEGIWVARTGDAPP